MFHTIPSVPASGLLGHLPAYKHNPLQFLCKNIQEYGDIFSFRVAHRHLVVINHPNYLKHILLQNHKNYIKNLAYRKLRMALGNGLFTSEGDFWAKQRKLAQPSFHRQKIDVFFEVMSSVSDTMLQKWRKAAEMQQEIKITDGLTEATLKIISKTLLGIEINEETNIIKSDLPPAMQIMIDRILTPINVPMWIPTSQNLRFKKYYQAINQVVLNIIAQKRKRLGYDLLSMLIEAQDEDSGERMTDLQLRDEVLTFFLAGHETTAVAMNWILYLLAQYPHIQQKLREEIQKNTITIESISQMPYLQAVIKESMRLYPPIWVLGREAIGNDEIGNYKVAKGTSIIFTPYAVHRHADFWKNPDAFSPERFLDKSNLLHHFAYLPFGAGMRMCIGNNFATLEMQVLLSKIIQSFKILLPSDISPIEFDFSLTLRPKPEIFLHFEACS